MAHNDFFVSESFVPELPRDIAEATTDFGFTVRIGNRDFEFEFSWNGQTESVDGVSRSPFYSLRIIRDDNTTVRKVFPRVNLPHRFEGFDPLDVDFPDAIVTILDGTGEDLPLTPRTFARANLVLIEKGAFFNA